MDGCDVRCFIDAVFEHGWDPGAYVLSMNTLPLPVIAREVPGLHVDTRST